LFVYLAEGPYHREEANPDDEKVRKGNQKVGQKNDDLDGAKARPKTKASPNVARRRGKQESNHVVK